MSDYGLYAQFAMDAARTAGKLMREGADGCVQVTSKGLRNLLTNIDLAAERAIVDAIRDRFPDHDLLTEETPPDEPRSRYRWVIDPLDGTGNFSRGYPCFSTSIALTEDDQPVVGIVYDPMLDHLFAATLGGGATLNGRSLQVSGVDALIDSLVGMDWTRDATTRAANARIIAALSPLCGSIRICGSAALGICHVGAGWWDAYWHLGLSPWDAAAAALIVREAGGQVTDIAGNRWEPREGPCLVSNGSVHSPLSAQISSAIGDLQ